MNYFKKMLEPFKEEYIVKTIAFLGIMGAFSILLSKFANIKVLPTLNIGFGSVANRVVDFVFGPIVGAIFGGVMDILKFFLNPGNGPFHFGFTFNAIVASILFGAVVYKKKITILRIFFANLLVKVIVNIGLNTFWLSQLYGKGFFAIIVPRLFSNVVMLGIDTALYFIIFKAISEIANNYLPDSNKKNYEAQ